MKYIKRFEKINISDYDINEYEEAEPEEDDNEWLESLVGGFVYKSTFIITLLNKNNGEITNSTLSTYRNNFLGYAKGRWNYGNHIILYDISIDIMKLKIVKMDHKSIKMISADSKSKRIYTISKKYALSKNKLEKYYIRQTDTLTFDEKDISESLMILYKKFEKQFNTGYNTQETQDKIDKKIKSGEKMLSSALYKKNELDFLMDNIDKLGVYITEYTLTRDYNTLIKHIKIKEKQLDVLKKTTISDSIEDKILNKIKNI